MTIRDFCDAAYALILREYERQGLLLTEALDRLQEWAVGRTQELEDEELEEERIARMNNESLAWLEGQLGGVRA